MKRQSAIEAAIASLLALGLGTCFAAGALFVFNIVAVLSYPDLADIAVKDHTLWGLMLPVLLVYGAGRISAEGWPASCSDGPASR
jgi:putative oxidoreductase